MLTSLLLDVMQLNKIFRIKKEMILMFDQTLLVAVLYISMSH